MKTLALALLLGSSSAMASTVGFWPVSAPSSYVFERDDRFVDGVLNRVTLTKNEDGTYNAEHTVVTPGFGSPVKTIVTTLGENLECNEIRPADALVVLNCSVDRRPADGALTEVIATINDNGNFDVTVHEAAYSMIPGHKGFDETREIASDLVRK